MTSKKQDFEVYDGDAKLLQIDIDPDKDLTGATVTWYLTQHDKPDSILVTKSIGSGITVTNAALGQFEVAIDEADTDGLASGENTVEYRHYARVLDTSGDTAVVTTGVVSVLPAP